MCNPHPPHKFICTLQPNSLQQRLSFLLLDFCAGDFEDINPAEEAVAYHCCCCHSPPLAQHAHSHIHTPKHDTSETQRSPRNGLTGRESSLTCGGTPAEESDSLETQKFCTAKEKGKHPSTIAQLGPLEVYLFLFRNHPAIHPINH